MTTPLTAPDLETLLDELLEVELSFRNTSGPAARLAALPRADQELVLALVRRLASVNVELGFQVAEHAPRALSAMDGRMLESWALHAADVYDRSGLRPALAAIREIERFVREGSERASGVVLDEEQGILLPFIHGLSGRRLKLEQGDAPWTDTETLFLPAVVARLPTVAENFQLYKSMAALLWAQVRFGTFRAPLAQALAEADDPGRLIELFETCETLRLTAALARELPGLARVMAAQSARLGDAPLPLTWSEIGDELAHPGADAAFSLHLARIRCEGLMPPPRRCWQGELKWEAAQERMAARVTREKALFRVKLAEMLEELRQKGAAANSAEPPRFDVRERGETPESMELTLDGAPLPIPDQVRQLAASIRLDLGEIPPDYLVPAGPGEYDLKKYQEDKPDLDNLWAGTYHEIGAHLYPEWDFKRAHYRKNWCAVRERTLAPVHDDFIADALRRHAPLIRHLRRSFEALRGEEKTLKRQSEGENIDIDALVDALADRHDGREMSDRLFTRKQRVDRNIAVSFLVDMSGSTRGWINDASREALLMLSEAIESLGDRYSIWGFSGQTRKRCEIYPVKRFDENYSDEVKARISAIRPQDYTRMGFAIRHATKLLAEQEARTRLLVTLSDGKPDDYSDYRGEYGIEDTRQALIEAKRLGIHAFCITLDKEGPAYLSHMYGPVNWVLVDDVRSLPLKVADIYRRLTS